MHVFRFHAAELAARSDTPVCPMQTRIVSQARAFSLFSPHGPCLGSYQHESRHSGGFHMFLSSTMPELERGRHGFPSPSLPAGGNGKRRNALTNIGRCLEHVWCGCMNVQPWSDERNGWLHGTKTTRLRRRRIKYSHLYLSRCMQVRFVLLPRREGRTEQ